MIVKVLVSLVFIGILSLCFWLLLCVLRDYLDQRSIIKGQRIRQQNSDVEYAKHIDVLKPKKWYKHKNFGVDPKVLKKPIEIMDYSVDCNGIIEKRGLA